MFVPMPGTTEARWLSTVVVLFVYCDRAVVVGSDELKSVISPTADGNLGACGISAA